MYRWLTGLVVASWAASAGAAGSLFHASSPRELAYQADTVVVALPIDPKQPGRFKVQHCLKGKLQAGQVIQVEGLLPLLGAEGDISCQNLAAACLFLTGEPGGASFQLAPTGIICLSRSNGIFRPVSAGEPGVFGLEPRADGEQWEALLARLHHDIAEVSRLQRARDLPHSRGRNRALLDWIELHRHEAQGSTWTGRPGGSEHLSAPLTAAAIQDQHDRGWGDLERLPFLWVLDSGALADCWRATDLYAEVAAGTCLGLDRPTWCSNAGREFLIGAALDDRQLEGSRRRALRLLASPLTLHGPRTPLVAAEQPALLERLRPLLKARTPTTRVLTAEAAREISKPIAPEIQYHKELLPSLVAAYKAEKAGKARDALAETVRLMGGVEHWQQLTGTPNGLAAYLQDVGTREQEVFFWLSVRSREPVQEAPTLTLERFNAFGFVAERKTQPLPALQPAPPKWQTEWTASLPLLVEVPTKKLELGTWRMVVEGTAGPDKVRWKSEPKLFKVMAAKQPGGMPGLQPALPLPYPVVPQQPLPRFPVVAAED